VPTDVRAGPLLTNLVAAHKAAERAIAYPELPHYAASLADLCDDMGSPLVWPVGEAAERLAGAAVLVSEGETRVRGWTDDLRGERALLVAVAAVSPLGLIEAARHARALGAYEVHACSIDVAGLDAPELRAVFDSRDTLSPRLPATA
jgi:hypothetical protein